MNAKNSKESAQSESTDSTIPTGARPIIESLAKDADVRVLTPMFDATGTVDVNGLKQFRDNTLRSDKKWTLSPFVSNPKLTLPKR